MQQPSLPPMEPIKPAAAPPQSPAPSAAAPKAQTPTAQAKGRMRQIVGYVGGASLGFIMLVCAGELVLKPGLRPTDLVATIEARTDLGIFNQKLGAKPGEILITEDQYRAKIAEAERSGQMKAEIAYQRELAAIQADRERVVGAYQTLYQRANAIAQAGLQLEGVAQQMRAQLIQATNGGRGVVIMFKDIFCGLGDAQSCASARADRGTMIAEADELSRGDVGSRIKELMAGVEDPAAFTVREDRQRNGVPTIRH
jgi:hypothetical protein